MELCKDHQIRTNQYYIAQLNSMEIKISELKAQLHAKNFEIDYLTTKFSQVTSSVQYKDLELELSAALRENTLLKQRLSELDNLQILKSQLEQALYMKEVFENKYRELKSQSMLKEKLDSSQDDKENAFHSLTAELEKSRQSHQETEVKLRQVCTELRSVKEELEKERILSAKRRQTEKNNKKESQRPYSVTLTRDSPLRVLQETQQRKNTILHSPKYCPSDSKRPRVVNISLETSLLRTYYKC